MIVTNKRLVTPKFIEFESIKIELVTQFKLLGVILDNKLNFIQHIGLQCTSINKKLFAIKRMFFLPFDVKLQFFKSFILPYFDYGSSLLVYFHKQAIHKLCKTYYLCLNKLFKFKFIDKTDDEINDSLKAFNLFSFITIE
jgi:hypothetical protein